MNVRDDLLRGAVDAPPACVDVLEKLQVLGRVDSGDRSATVVVGRDHLVSLAAGGVEQDLGPGGHLRIGLGRATDQEMPRIVVQLVRMKDDLHDAG